MTEEHIKISPVNQKQIISVLLNPPCAAHDLWPIEGEGIGLIGLRPHLVGFRQHCVCEKVVGLKVEL